MRIFVTGASGWIGSAVVPELLGAGHQVLGLARSEESARALAATGAEVRRGSLDDLEVLAAAAAESDGVVHLAYRHDLAFTGDAAGAARADNDAITALGDALAGSDRPLVIASGLAGLKPGELATEQDRPRLDGPMGGRSRNEQQTLALAERGVRGVRGVSVRLAPTVHGEGDPGFIAFVVGIARQQGSSAYIGDGENRWPAVHRSDAARLFRLAVEGAPAGTVLHAAAEEGIPLREVAEAIGRQLDLPVVSVPAEQAADHFGFLGVFLGADIPVSSTQTRELLGWEPTGPTLLDDVDQGRYTGSP